MTIAKIWNDDTGQWEPAVIGAQGPVGATGAHPSLFSTPIPGHYFAPPGVGGNISTYEIYQKLFFAPIFIPKPITIDRITTFVTASDEISPIWFGLWASNADILPSTLLFSDSTVSLNVDYTTGIPATEVSCSIELNTGWYWVGVVSFDDANAKAYTYHSSDYSQTVPPYVSLGADSGQIFLWTGWNSYVPVVCEATSLGSSTPATVTSIPSTVTPGIYFFQGSGGTEATGTPLILLRRAS